MTEVEEVPSILLPCGVCGRTFRPEALSKHSLVCEKQHAKKRKKFDSAKQRIQGTELAEFLGPPPVASKPRPKPPSPKKAQSRWKEKHEALVRTMRDDHAKPVDHQQCVYCDRFFGPKAFDRHVTWCKEQHCKIQVQVHSEDVSKAKQRLHARTKYRAPSFRSQRSVTKEKYSPQRMAGSVAATMPSPTSRDNLPRIASNTSSTVSEGGVQSGRRGAVGVAGSTRQNSLPRAARRDDPVRKSQDGSVSHTASRTSRAGSLSSQASDTGRSISSTISTHSVGAGDMASSYCLPADTKPPPTIKPSLSTNRKGKKDDVSESKKWKRQKEVSADPGVGADPAMCAVIQSHENAAGKPGRKLWTRLKSKTSNNNPLNCDRIEKKSKKSKVKRKNKIVSPAKSNSSRKTITLSDGGLNSEVQDNLRDLAVTDDTDLDDFTAEKCRDDAELSPCYDTSSNSIVPSQNCTFTFGPRSLSVCEVFEDIPLETTTVAPIEEPLDLLSSLEVRPIFSESLPVRVVSETSCTRLTAEENISGGSSTCSRDIEVAKESNDCSNLMAENLSRTKSDETTKPSRSRRKESSKCDKYPVESESNDSLIQKDPEPFLMIYKKTEVSPVEGKTVLGSDENTSSQEELEKVAYTNFEPPLNNLKYAEDLLKETSFYNVKTSNQDKPLPGGKATATDAFKMHRDSCADENVVPLKSSVTLRSLPSNNVVEKCECRKIFSAVKHQLYLLSKCKCMIHRTGASFSHLVGSKSSGVLREDGCVDDECCKQSWENLTARKDAMVTSFSDPESYSNGKRNFKRNVGLGKPHVGLSEVEVSLKLTGGIKNGTIDATTQTEDLTIYPSFTDSEGSLCFEPIRESVKDDVWWNRGQDVGSDRHNYEGSDWGGGSIIKSMNCGRVGERLRDVRRLLSRNSLERRSNSSFGYLEDDRSTNDSMKDENVAGRCIETVDGEDAGDFAVVMTSVKRLSDPRRKLNRRLAQREWQLVQANAPVKSNMNQADATFTAGHREMGMGDNFSSGYHPSAALHLPPLSNSTPKRLNRRWSPSCDQNAGAGGGVDDGSGSKFCHECGGRYPVPGAKFCCLCGVRRLAI